MQTLSAGNKCNALDLWVKFVRLSNTGFKVSQSKVNSAGQSCREGCGACCISPSISTPIPGMPGGKPAGTRCIQLDERNMCRLFGKPERPAVCTAFIADQLTCGENREEAMLRILELEQLTMG